MNMHPVSCFNACVKVGYFESAKEPYLVPPISKIDTTQEVGQNILF